MKAESVNQHKYDFWSQLKHKDSEETSQDQINGQSEGEVNGELDVAQTFKLLSKVGNEQAQSFSQIDPSVGTQLLQPILSKCFHLREDIWLYKFCIGESIDQYHIEANGTISEEFNLGRSNISAAYNQQIAETMSEEDPESEIYDMILNSNIPYLTVDKESGILLRFFNIPHEQSLINRKADIVQIPIHVNGQLTFERRNILEMINENTVIIDKPFTNYTSLPDYIFDFKNILMEGNAGKNQDQMSKTERQQHLKSYGLEIINHKMVYCKRCNFAVNYDIGDTLVFEHDYKTQTAIIKRIIEDNLMEIESQDKLFDKEIITIDDYYVISGNQTKSILWHSHNTNAIPELSINDSYLSCKEGSLNQILKVGDILFFKKLANKEIKMIKLRKALGPFFQVLRILEDGFTAELGVIDSQSNLTFTIDGLSINNTEQYIIGSQSDYSNNITLNSSPYQLTKLKFEQQKRSSKKFYQTAYQLNHQGVLTYQIKQSKRGEDFKLRMIMYESNIDGNLSLNNFDQIYQNQSQPLIDLVYNSKHGLLVNGKHLHKFFDNSTSLVFILDQNDTMYLADNGTSFANIYHTFKLGGLSSKRLQIDFDIEYSDQIEVSEIRTIPKLPLKLQSQLNFFTKVAPNTQKSYHVEHYSNGTVCAVNNQPRQVTIFYYCDYFHASEATISEISEPDWCSYHVKIVTKYMCGKWAQQIQNSKELDYDQKRDQTDVRCYTRRLGDNNQKMIVDE
eukprot:403355285